MTYLFASTVVAARAEKPCAGVVVCGQQGPAMIPAINHAQARDPGGPAS